MSPWFGFCRAAAAGLARLLWGFRVEGLENVPRRGAVVVACNHVSTLDPPLVGSALRREAGFVAKQELFAVPLLGPLIRSLHAMPIDRSRLSRDTLDTLAAFLDRLGVDGPFVLKMDIESWEHEAILGSPELFRQQRVRALFLELHPNLLQQRGLDPAAIPDFLTACGYTHAPDTHGLVWIPATSAS